MDPSSGRGTSDPEDYYDLCQNMFMHILLRIRSHIFYIFYKELELVLTQWNHHRVDYLRPTGLFCLVSKHFLCTSFLRIRSHIFLYILQRTRTCLDTVDPSTGRLPPAHKIILPCVKIFVSISY